MSDQTTPFISVIVPAYNLEKLIERCLDSISAQTFQDWECIIVDDGSTDLTGAVCDAYAARHSRFRVLHQENGGVSSARNAGMAIAQGQYFLFVDGDDAIDSRMMEWLKKRQQENSKALLSWMLRLPHELAPDYKEVPIPREYAAIQRQAYISVGWGTNVTNKLFWADVVREGKVQYNTSLARGEDYAFCWDFLEALFQLYPDTVVQQYDMPMYIVYEDNCGQRASSKKIASHPIEWDPEESYQYAAHLIAEYRQMIASMGGFEDMLEDERLSIAHQYIRRFAFAVWAAHELKETLPENFFTGPEVSGLVAAMKQYRLYDAYYWPFVLQWKWLIRKMYHSDESESKKLYWKVFLVGDILLGRKWKRM